ncbi:ATP-binding protein [Streptomyces sp. NPDC050485]|uniref:ATP-binding protein n=1 Tax=Streptomyces sp. NPDC050485 TaxID=3365617 RepID=UPI0037B452FA
MNPQSAVTATEFVQRFSSTRRGARLARWLAVQQLDAWGIPYGSPRSDAAALVVAEFAANAVTHGHVPGRDFELRITLGELLRIEVGDARGEREPAPSAPVPGEAECGHGLLLVAAVAVAWGVKARPGVGKVVWAELHPDDQRRGVV